MQRKLVKLGIWSAVIVLIAVSATLYCESYLNHREKSGYYLTQSGELRYGFGLSASDLEQWTPDACWWQPAFMTVTGERFSRGNFAGYLYSPLIAMDRRLNFPDRRVLTIDDFGIGEENQPATPAEQNTAPNP